MNNLKITNSIFENIKHIDEEEREWWSARELVPLLEYSKWQNFHKVIKQSMIACDNSKNKTKEHFTEVSKVLRKWSKAKS